MSCYQLLRRTQHEIDEAQRTLDEVVAQKTAIDTKIAAAQKTLEKAQENHSVQEHEEVFLKAEQEIKDTHQQACLEKCTAYLAAKEKSEEQRSIVQDADKKARANNLNQPGCHEHEDLILALAFALADANRALAEEKAEHAYQKAMTEAYEKIVSDIKFKTKPQVQAPDATINQRWAD
jgi:hypothetical protein